MSSVNTTINNINGLVNKTILDNKIDFTKNIQYQTKYMNSELYNNNLDTVYDCITKLYEKTRCLYELSYTIEDYINTSCNEMIAQSEKLLDKIERQRDSLKKSTDLIFIVDFENMYDSNNTDRDGSIIEHKTSIISDAITLHPTYSQDININDNNIVITKQDSIKRYNYHNNNLLTIGGSYVTSYGLSFMQDITEKVSIVFDSPIEMNVLDLKLLNCEYSNLTYILSNDIRISVSEPVIISTLYNIKSIEFEIICSNPQISTYTIESTVDTEYFINSIVTQKTDNTIVSSNHIKQYSSSIDTYNDIKNKFDGIINGFYADDQSISYHISMNTKPYISTQEMINQFTAFGNPYPSIQNHTPLEIFAKTKQ